MLPTRAYAPNIPIFSPGGRAMAEPSAYATLLVVGPQGMADRVSASSFTRVAAHTTADALRAIDRAHPRVIAIDWEAEGIDGPGICAAARVFMSTGILALLDEPRHAPAALKAGCHAILLRPCAPNLVAARLGRLYREMPTSVAAARALATVQQVGTNRVWPETACPACAQAGPTSFEFSSYRRMWYACLSCEHVWLGPRQE